MQSKNEISGEIYSANDRVYQTQEAANTWNSLHVGRHSKWKEAAFQRFCGYVNANSGKVLDIGCGPGHQVGSMREAGLNAWGVDASEPFLKIARERYGDFFLKLDIRNLSSLPSEDYLAIWCCALFVHIPREDAVFVLSQMHRILKPDGLLFLTTKMGRGVYHDQEIGDQYKRIMVLYEEQEMKEYLKKAGFKILDYQEHASEHATATTWMVLGAKKE